MKHKTIDSVVFRTTSKTFQEYWLEMRRHEDALKRIYGKDKLHKHIPEAVGSVNQVYPKHRHIVTFWRCALCMRDLTEKQVRKINKTK